MPALLTSMSNSMPPASFAAAAPKVLHHPARVRIEPIVDEIESALVGKSRFIRRPEIDEDVHLARIGVLPVTSEAGVIEIPALIDIEAAACGCWQAASRNTSPIGGSRRTRLNTILLAADAAHAFARRPLVLTRIPRLCNRCRRDPGAASDRPHMFSMASLAR
jgi:hypothetical protein